MKISNMKVIVTCPGRNFVFVKIETDEGIYGVGDATLMGRELAVASLLEEHLRPLLIGRDPDQIEDTWQYIFRGTYWRGGPVIMTAIAGIDMALWDIKGKRANLPVYSLLGGKCRERVLCYTHAGGSNFDEIEESVRACMEQGFKVIRVIPGAIREGQSGRRAAAFFPKGDSLPRVEIFEPHPQMRMLPKLFDHLRAKVGWDVEFIFDAHGRFTPIEAAQLAKDLEPYRLFYLEDLLRPEHKESFRTVRRHSTTPLAQGEQFFTMWECLPLVTEQLIDYVRYDLSTTGGITQAKKIATIAEPYYVKTAWHGPAVGPMSHAANVHLDLAIANFGVQEYPLMPEPVLEVAPGMPKVEDGYVMVTDAPGLGCDIDEQLAKKYPYERGYIPVVRRLDGSVHDF